ncbi:hypothetical protein LZD49_20195 [Dyadobacter sp. CY261]|nr:hypothetical protein [Dyadobacter sp. CY261]MCF0072813.1 hypothetical protein [Dyadobacter sp. CY261]
MKELLGGAGMLVPAGMTVSSEEEVLQAVAELGYPLVVKPLDANQKPGHI